MCRSTASRCARHSLAGTTATTRPRDYWRARKLRQEVLEGRQELAEQIASTILERLRQACERLRQACAAHPDTADAVRALADELEAQGAVALDALDEPETGTDGEEERLGGGDA